MKIVLILLSAGSFLGFGLSCFASALRELRKGHALTQENVSKLSGVAYKYYQQIEIGLRIDLRLSTLEKLAKAYNIGVHELLAPTLPKTRAVKPTAKKSKHTV